MNILIYGFGGKMGKMLYENIKNTENCVAVCGIDKFFSGACDIPVYKDINEVTEKIDVIIDFSVRMAVYDIVKYAMTNKIPCVMCTTGYTETEQNAIVEASKIIPIFQSGNMSLGINVISRLAKMATALFGDKADIEIIEAHHNQKIDAPSGTALLLANAIKEEKTDADFIFGRSGEVGKRTKQEVGIHAIRGGSIVGKHEVMFILNNEVITIKHEAENKGVFAQGAISAAKFLIGKDPGLYDMNAMLK